MPDQSLNEYVLINTCEELVKEKVLEKATNIGMCTCERCISDACALVLNQLLPNYVTTRKGEVLNKVRYSGRREQIDLTVKVVQALKLVNESPRH